MNAKRSKIIAAMLLGMALLLCVIVRCDIAHAEEYDIASDEVDNVKAVAMATDTSPIPNNGIPVLMLDIDPDEYQKVIDSPNHDYRAYTGTIRIDVPEGYVGEFSETELTSLGTTPLEYLRGRGNSSWNDDKKPFKFKLDESTNLLGMGKSKHWVLLSNMQDPSLLRNRLTAYMARELGMEFVPAMTPVDFVVNGEYQGSYVLSHQVRIEKSTVNIDELTADDLFEPEITGGYLLALHPYDDEAEINTFQTERGVDFLFDGPDFSEVNEENRDALEAQRAYIVAYLQRTEDAIFGEGFLDADGVHCSEYLDLDSAASYWWIQEFSSNVDAYRTSSTYLYKKREGKLYWGPVWDFDRAYDYTDEGLSSLNTATSMPWIDHLRGHDPAFLQLLRNRWDEFDQVLQGITCEGGVLDQYAAEIKASWDSDYDHWSALSPVSMPTYDEAISSLRDGIEARRAAINAIVDDALDDVFCIVTFVVDGEAVKTVEIKQGDPLLAEHFAEDPCKEGFWFYRWETEDGVRASPYMRFSGDAVINAAFIPDEDVIRPELIAFRLYDQWVDINEGTWYADYAIRPRDVQDDKLAWTSSNPEVATVDAHGNVGLCALGATTITCTAANGVASSLVLHVFDSNVAPAQDATSLRFEAESLTLYPGQFGQVRVAIEPQPTTANLMYESSNEDVAYVSGFGVVEGVAPGTCTIVVRDAESGLEATYQVTVVEPEDESPDDKGGGNPADTNRDDGNDTNREAGEDTDRDNSDDANRGDDNDTNRKDGADTNRDDGNDANREGGTKANRDDGNDTNWGAGANTNRDTGNERTGTSHTNKALPQTDDNTVQLMSWASASILAGLLALGLGISQHLLLRES